MITDIGIVAGNILELLENRNGVLVFGEIHVDLKQPRDLVLMSLGWLLYEKYVLILEDPWTAAYRVDDRNRTYTGIAGVTDLVVGSKVVTAASKRIKNVLDHQGVVANKILTLLEVCGGSLDLQTMEHNINEHRDIILMGLGRLVREGCVQGFVGTNEVFVFHLPKETASLKMESLSHV
jgi:hypothetical protein